MREAGRGGADAREGIDVLDGEVLEGIDELDGEVLEGIDELPLADGHGGARGAKDVDVGVGGDDADAELGVGGDDTDAAPEGWTRGRSLGVEPAEEREQAEDGEKRGPKGAVVTHGERENFFLQRYKKNRNKK